MHAGASPPTPDSSSPEQHLSPPTPPPEAQPNIERALPNAEASADPPPPYPSRERRSRNERARLRRAAQLQSDGALVVNTSTMQPLRIPADQLVISSQGDLSPLSPEDGTESTPLLVARRRPRTMSLSTGVSAQSIAHTVLSLLGADEDDIEREADVMGDASSPDVEANSPSAHRPRRIRRYFRPLWRIAYYRALIHLLLINFFYGLVAFVYLFVGTLTGTTLLIALPLGVVICWLNLAGARMFAKGEIALQSYFHGPLFLNTAITSYPIFSRPSVPSSEEGLTSEERRRPSFLKNTYIMFTDQTTFQALFYFLVIKPSITLFLSIVLVVLVPIAFVLVLPAPALLRAIKRIGVWQASIAMEGLLLPRL